MRTLSLAVVLLAGCIIRSAPAPMPSREYRASPTARSKCLVVFLPGFADPVETFADRGFIDDMREAGLDADAVAMDAHLRYYLKETILDRLYEDVVVPARARGYERLLFVGVSMGGIGALAFAHEHPADVHGLVLFAPYTGPASVHREIEAAGGIARWQTNRPGERYRELWLWLKGSLDPAEKRPPLYVAFGRRDRGFRGYRLLTGATKPTRVFVNGGGHGWSTWRPLWQSLLRVHGKTMCAAAER